MSKSLLLTARAFLLLALVFSAREIRADSTVSGLSAATTLTGGVTYFDQGGSNDRKLGFDPTLFGLTGSSLTLLPAGITSSLLATTGVSPAAYTCMNGTVNAQGQLTSVSTSSCLLSGATAGGALSGAYPNPTLQAGAVSYNNIQNETAQTILCNPTGVLGRPRECALGSNLSFTGNVINAANSGGTVTSVMAGNPGVAVAPTSGNVVVSAQFPVQPAKTTSYTLVAGDAFNTIPANCASSCTFTINSSSVSYFPPGYAVNILNAGQGTLTVMIGTGSSIFYGASALGSVSSFTLPATGSAYIQADNNAAPNNYAVNVSGVSLAAACVMTASGTCATVTKTIQVACNASIDTAITNGGGGSDALHVVVYQLVGTVGTPCTYSAQQFHTANNVVIQGQADSLANPIGASTILDGGDGGASAGAHFMTCGLPSAASPSAFCPGATGDGTSNVTIQYVTIQNYGGSKTCPTTGSTNGCQNVSPNECGWQQPASDTAENWCPQFQAWNNWLFNHVHLTLSGGYAGELVGGGGVVQNSLIDHNYHGGVLVETTYAFGNNGGPFSLINNEATDNNKRGDDPLNDANGLTKSVSRADLGGPENSVTVINNYVHDNFGVGIWSDIDSSHAIKFQGNTVINSIAPAGTYASYGVDCIRDEINSGPADISHNVIIGCGNGDTISLTNASNLSAYNNYSYVDNVAYASSGGIVEVITCRADNPSGIIPGVAVNVDGNITVFAQNLNFNGAGGLTGYFDYTGTGNAPQGAGCAQPFPSVAQYATTNFGNRVGNLYYSPQGSNDQHWGFAAQGNAGLKLSWAQGNGNPQQGPASNNAVVGYATGGDCNLHLTTVPAAYTVLLGSSYWGQGENTPITVQAFNSGTGGVGTYFDNWCPTFGNAGGAITASITGSSGTTATLNVTVGTANVVLGNTMLTGGSVVVGSYISGGSSPTWTLKCPSNCVNVGSEAMTVGPPTFNAVFGGNQELGSSVRPGATLATSTVSSSGLLTLGATTATGAIVVGQLAAANDGTHRLPFGTYVKSLVSNAGTLGNTVGSTWQLSQNPLVGAITSTSVYFNATKSYVTGCTNPITLGGCPNGSGI